MKKRTINKLIAGALSLTVLCVSAPTAFIDQNGADKSGINAFAASGVIFSADFEDGVNAFTRRGETEVLEITDTEANSGTHSLCISGREKSWNGPQLALDDIIEAGTEYVVSASAKTPWYSTVTLSMQYNDADGETHYANIHPETSQGEWVQYTDIKFSFPTGSTDMYLYFEAGDANANVYIDDFILSNAPEVQIEDIASLDDVYEGYFKIGNAIMASNLASKPFMSLFEKHFNDSMTFGNELKPDFVLDKNASLAYYQETGDETNPQVTLASAKSLLDYCRDNNIPVRGHTLVWHSQTPDWFFKEGYSDDGAWVSKEVMISRMENYIKNVMETLAEEYPTVDFYAWDVVNEAWTDSGTPRKAGSNNTTSGESAWVKVFGDNSFIEYAFKFARMYAPEGCMLYYNDYNEYMPQKTTAIVEMANSLKEKGLIDGIGMQSHLDVSFPSATAYETALKKFADTGLDVQITELDVTTSDTSASGLETQAQYYSDIFDVLVKYSDSISAVVLWGITDDQSWRASREPLIFDADYIAKPAYYSIVDDVESRAESTTEANILYGDANVSGKVDVADVVAVRRYLVNSEKYPLSAQGAINSDVQGGSNGINAQDAVAIQKAVLGIITALPVE